MQAEDSLANVGRALGCLTWITEADDYDKLAPIGTVGELLLEGPILCSYFKKVDANGTSFIYDPVWSRSLPKAFPDRSAKKHRRFYRTGDMVRYEADGTIEFKGRRDSQVSLHGMRDWS